MRVFVFVCCTLCVVGCLLWVFDVCWVMYVVCCVHALWIVDCCLMVVGCCVFGVCWLFVD